MIWDIIAHSISCVLKNNTDDQETAIIISNDWETDVLKYIPKYDSRGKREEGILLQAGEIRLRMPLLDKVYSLMLLMITIDLMMVMVVAVTWQWRWWQLHTHTHTDTSRNLSTISLYSAQLPNVSAYITIYLKRKVCTFCFAVSFLSSIWY